MYTISQLNICEQLLIFFAIRQLPIICHSNFRDLTTLIRIDSWNWIYEIFIILFIWAVAPAKSSIKWLIIFYALYVFLKTHKKVALVTNSNAHTVKKANFWHCCNIQLHDNVPTYTTAPRKFIEEKQLRLFSSDMKIISILFYPTFFLHVIRL